MIIGNLSHNDTLRIKALLAPHGSEVKQPHPVKYISGDNSVKKEVGTTTAGNQLAFP